MFNRGVSMTGKLGNIGVATLGELRRGKAPLLNLIDILCNMSNDVYLLPVYELNISSTGDKPIHIFNTKQWKKADRGPGLRGLV